uniref:Uncharacterized protein n=1 Tax=Caenorhabditis japonica TaxID=281687 RepID=A0A8R1EGL8_CAEJA
MDDMKSDPTPQKSEKGVPPEVSKKWGLLVFKIYERMVHASDVSFFISSPQIISTLGFILGVADTEDTKGLMKAYANGATDEQGANIDWLLDNTLKFVHNWSAEFKQLLGQYHRARRVYAHPKFVMPHNANTFQFFRLFRVQEKIFEGYEEVRDWAARSLKVFVFQMKKHFPKLTRYQHLLNFRTFKFFHEESQHDKTQLK